MFGTKKGETAVLEKISTFPQAQRPMAQRLHRIVRENAPGLEPAVRWGLVFYRNDGKDVCYIKSGDSFLAFGFTEEANPAREAGASLHAVAWVVTSLDAAAEAKVAALVRKAAGAKELMA